MKPLADDSQRLWTDELLHAPHEARDKADRVRGMFNAIADRYELVNRVCSGGRDRYWRRRAVRLARVGSEDSVLDIACGTGDFARAFHRIGPKKVVGCDFAHKMLVSAIGSGSETIDWVEADALRLPFRCGSFTIASCAFGVRNFQNLDSGLQEMHRVLRPGGRAVVLEFTRPGNSIIRRFYEFYSHRVMPAAATLISGDRTGAYRYLPKSVVSFAAPQRVCDGLRKAGFDRVLETPLTFGVVTVYVAFRS